MVCDEKQESCPKAISIYRDTRCSQSLITEASHRQGIENSDTGRSVVLASVTGECIAVRLHRVFVCSRFVTGPVVMGLTKSLPLYGVVGR